MQHRQRQLLAAYKQVLGQSQHRQEWDQWRYNRRVKAYLLLPGERVLCKNFRRRVWGKLGPFWVPEPWVVVSQLNHEQAIYTAHPEGTEGPNRTIHWNNMHPCPGSWTTQDPKGNPRRVGLANEIGFWPIDVSTDSCQTGEGAPEVCGVLLIASWTVC